MSRRKRDRKRKLRKSRPEVPPTLREQLVAWVVVALAVVVVLALVAWEVLGNLEFFGLVSADGVKGLSSPWREVVTWGWRGLCVLAVVVAVWWWWDRFRTRKWPGGGENPPGTFGPTGIP